MKIKIVVVIAVIVSLPVPAFAEQGQAPLEFDAVYKHLGFVDDGEVNRRLADLKQSLVGRDIQWSLTLKSVYESGRPNFRETFKTVNDTTKLSTVKFFIHKQYASHWKRLSWGEKVAFTGRITNVATVSMEDSNNTTRPFVYIEVSECIPLSQ